MLLDIKYINMEMLPKKLTVKGEEYTLFETQFPDTDDLLPGWWSLRYCKSLDDLPPYVHNSSEYYYLCCCEPTREEAYNDMLERINTMKDV